MFRKGKQERLASSLANPKTEILQLSYNEETVCNHRCRQRQLLR
jgi:hypothetical protein